MNEAENKTNPDWMVLEDVALEYLTGENRETRERENRGEVSVQVQRRRRADGKWSGPFVNLKLSLNFRSLYLNLDMVQQLQDVLDKVMPAFREADDKLRREAETRREEGRAAWEAGLAGQQGDRQRAKHTGKTEREHAKGKDSRARKVERSTKDKALRTSMRGRGG